MGDWEKTAVMEEILADCRLPREEIAFVGDDITDVVCFRRVGFSIAVANAVAEVKDLADYVTQVPGGRGAIREVAELILKAQGKWDDVLRHYEVVV
jgi:3-deoxy-D-manno-octulosonate 8-phosphate phosphatase (KDO 8-P phosphatase)